MRRRASSKRGGRAAGQVMVVAALLLMVLVAMAGLVLSGSHDFLSKRDVQAAVDAASIAAADDWVNAETQPNADCTGANGNWTVHHAWRIAHLDGIVTADATSPTSCQVGNIVINGYPVTADQFCDGPTAPACTSGWTNKLVIYFYQLCDQVTSVCPAPQDPNCNSLDDEVCVSVSAWQVEPNVLGGVLVAPTTTVYATAVAGVPEGVTLIS